MEWRINCLHDGWVPGQGHPESAERLAAQRWPAKRGKGWTLAEMAKGLVKNGNGIH